MGEQLPSGIPLFFALALLLAAVFVFFSGGEGASAPSTILAVALTVLGGTFVWLGTSGQEVQPETMARIEPENTMESTSEETRGAVRLTEQPQERDTTVSYANYCVEKQFTEATRNLNPQQVTDYENGVINESVARSVDPRTVLAERGFPC